MTRLPSFAWFDAKCVRRVYAMPGGICGARVHVDVGWRDGGPARVGAGDYVYACRLLDFPAGVKEERLHAHQERAVWLPPLPPDRDLGWQGRFALVRPSWKRVRPEAPRPTPTTVQVRL